MSCSFRTPFFSACQELCIMQQGSLHEQHKNIATCKWWFPFILVKKPHVSNGGNMEISFKEPCAACRSFGAFAKSARPKALAYETKNAPPPRAPPPPTPPTPPTPQPQARRFRLVLPLRTPYLLPGEVESQVPGAIEPLRPDAPRPMQMDPSGKGSWVGGWVGASMLV